MPAKSSLGPHAKSAFSLVELSIVLVILGLLTGGILTGQSLIRAAELRSITTEFQGYQTAVMTFKDKYFALPGDMQNATDFWGAMSNCGAASPSGTGTDTCNGNGDGIINIASAASQTAEIFNFWLQLANAGLIEGSYTGIAGNGGSADHDAGINSPTSRLGNASWGASWIDNSGDTNPTGWTKNYTNWMTIGIPASSFADGADGNLIANEAWSIDKKIDDGKPGSGKVNSYGGGLCSDQTDNANWQIATYNLSRTDKNCSIFFNYLSR